MNKQQQQKQQNYEGGEQQTKVIKSFEDFGLKYELVRGIYAFGYEEPSSIQKQGIPVILTKRNCIIQGQSGTGKTATFMISALQLLEKSSNVQCLIMIPTRQLAYQINNAAVGLNEFTKLKVKSFVGGTRVDQDKKALANGQVNIAIGTPGRLKQMIEKKWLKTDFIKLLILDEADEMIQGFEEAMKEIFAFLPSDVQIVLISATMPKPVLEITEEFMNDSIKILLEKKDVRVKGIKQFMVPMKQNSQKLGTLIQIYKNIEITQCIVFVNTKERAVELTQKLNQLKFPVTCLTGATQSEQRRLVMQNFRQGMTRVLISTDLIGRGIDVQQVNLVINYDLPNDLEKYMHRIGRTGRIGRKGVAINFVTQGDATNLAQIQNEYKNKMEELPLDLANIYQ